MDDKELQEFSLEDIIREFSDDPLPPEETVEDTSATPPEETDTAEETITEAAPEAEETVKEETAQVPEQPAPAVTDETIRLDTTKFAHGTVRNAQKLTEEDDAVDMAPPAPVDRSVTEEDFAGDWEPQYEQPIAEYVPPQPIIFRPRSRLQELKRKLVAGPERRYYELSEKGLGKLQAAIFFSLLLVLILGAVTVMYALGMVPQERLRLMVFFQFLLMLVAALLGSQQIIEGVADLFKGRFSLNTLLVFTFIACCADGVIGLQQQRISCCAAFSLVTTMSLWSSYQRRNTELGQMDTMRKATNLDAVTVCPEYHTVTNKKGKTQTRNGLLRSEGQVEDFMDHYNAPQKPEKVLNWYALIALVAAIGIGVAATVLYDWTVGVQVMTVTLLAATPATIHITLSRPMAVLERRLHSVGTVLCGWTGVEKLRGKAVFPVTHEDLFPSGSTKMNGVKFFGKQDPDEVVACAAALVEASGSGLSPLFAQLLASRSGRHYMADCLMLYEGGVTGVVNGQTVAAGSLSFLQALEIQVPDGVRVSSAVYVAIDGELCGLFAITYEKLRSAAAGIHALCAYRGLNPLVVSDDFALTENFLRSKFGLPGQRLLFPEYEIRQQLREKQPAQEDTVALLTTRSDLAASAFGVIGARALYNACRLGMILHLLGGMLGIAVMVVLTLLGALHLLTPVNMLLYQLVWMLPGLMITEWTRHL